MQLSTFPTCIFGLTYFSAHQPEVTCPTTVFICCCALWFCLPRILTQQRCVTSAVLNVGKMRSEHLNEYPRVTVWKARIKLTWTRAVVKNSSPVCPPFIFTINSQGRCLLKTFLTTSLVPTHSLFWPSIWNISTPTMYFCFIPKINYLQSFRDRWGSPQADCHFHLVCFLEIWSWFFKSNCSNSFLGKRKYFCNSCWSSGMLLLFTATAFRSLRNGPEAYCDQCCRNIRWKMLPAFSDAG